MSQRNPRWDEWSPDRHDVSPTDKLCGIVHVVATCAVCVLVPAFLMAAAMITLICIVQYI